MMRSAAIWFPTFNTGRKKAEWLRIQEKKLDTLLHDPKSKKIKPETLKRWIRETRDDIEKTRKELGYEDQTKPEDKA